MGHKNIFSDHVSIGMNEYVFNIVMSIDESFHLIIAESSPLDGRLDHKRIRIPIENARGLRDALNRAIAKIDKIDLMKFVSRSSLLDNVRGKNTIDDQTIKTEKREKVTNYIPSGTKDGIRSSNDILYDEQRKLYPQAYMPWSTEDDERLEKLFCNGTSTKELAKMFQRNPGAIRSRIKKLELREKYG
ncbi:hypothetical protein [Sphingobacterium faecale]|uniref:Uncharacterized protein n=1 Tax=Sphingobacterium faecale TaxID=2803775 RepID=A0ABS1R276_9SPHI|nr:hypothetical protein [Sphingobacterium faecale]MBL1408807.1 hypothetical protein [Sphingobacterium faecale]